MQFFPGLSLRNGSFPGSSYCVHLAPAIAPRLGSRKEIFEVHRCFSFFEVTEQALLTSPRDFVAVQLLFLRSPGFLSGVLQQVLSKTVPRRYWTLVQQGGGDHPAPLNRSPARQSATGMVNGNVRPMSLGGRSIVWLYDGIYVRDAALLPRRAALTLPGS
jgi:hypothetical protein